MGLAPKISVLIPTFRYARFLPEAIASVLAQDFDDFELIVSDDASGDGSEAILRDFASRDPRIRAHVHRQNLGMVAHWNWCLHQARGEYVQYVFGDDKLCLPSALRTLSGLLDAEPRAVLAASARAILGPTSERIDVWDYLGEGGYQEGADVIARCFERDRNLVGEPSAVMFRRVAAARGFDRTMRQLVDEEMWFHLLARGQGLVYTPQALCGFRRHAAQQTVANQALGVASIENLRIMTRYFDHYARAAGLLPGSAAMRHRIFRLRYYSCKDARTREAARAADTILRPYLPGPWYAWCWLHHRLARPFENAALSYRKRWPLPAAPRAVPPLSPRVSSL